MQKSRTPARSAVPGHRPLLLAMAIAAAFGSPRLHAQPAGLAAVHGSATVSTSGSTTTITTTNGGTTNHSVLNWSSFNVPGGTTTHFQQPSATSTSINRVVEANPSSILGTLSSNGHLVLVNPYGIAVGAGASIDTAGFTASTIRMTDADALAGVLRFAGGTEGGVLDVKGQILARQGDVVLIGPNVQAGADAVIQSLDGAVILAAGQAVNVTGRGLEGIVFEVKAPEDQAINLGTLQGDAVGIFASTLRHSGLIRAEAIGTAGGKVVLRAASMTETTAGSAVQADGSVDIRAEAGGVKLSGSVSAGTDMLVSAQRGDTGSGRIEIDAPLSARRLALVSDGNDGAGIGIGQTLAGAIDADELVVGASGGSVVLTNPDNRIGALAAGAVALDLVTSTSELSIGQRLGNEFLQGEFGGLQTLLSARIDVRAPQVLPMVAAPSPAGSIRIEAGSVVDTGALVLKAAGDIVARPRNESEGVVVPATTLRTWGEDPAGLGFVDLEAGGAIHVGDIETQPSAGVAGGAVRLRAAGAISTGTIRTDAYGGSAGAQAGWIHLESGDGITVSGSLSARGASGYATGGSGNFVSLSAGSGGIVVTEGIDTSGGSGSLGGGNGGLVDLQSSGDIVVTGSIQTDGGSAWGSGKGGDGGTVLASAGGALQLDEVRAYGGYGHNAGGTGGSLALAGGHSVQVQGALVANGGNSGNVGAAGGTIQVTSASGSVQLNGVEALGGGGSLGGGTGGMVQLGAQTDLAVTGTIYTAGGWALQQGPGGHGGNVVASAGGALALHHVDSSGGQGYAGGAGGDAGDVTLTGGTRVQAGHVYAAGGWGGDAGSGQGGDGGQGGTVRITQASGDLDLSGMYVDAGGGGGGDGSAGGGHGGHGGNIEVTALQGGVITSGWMGDASGTSLYTGGGWGGDGVGTAGSADGGQGGDAGNVTIKAAGDSRLEGYIAAHGGDGGGVHPEGAAVGGQGGRGGSITLELTQPGAQMLLAGDLYADGGYGGRPRGQEVAGTSEPTRTGAAGSGGSLVTIGGRMRIEPFQYGGYGLLDSGSSPSPSGMWLPSWTNRSHVVVASGVGVVAPQVRNFGTLELEADSTLRLGRYEYDPGNYEAPPTFLMAEAALLNEATGVLRGHGTVEGHVRNFGTIAPGSDVAPMGVFNIVGDLVMESGSKLQIDAWTGVPFQPGITYDQVRVDGTLTAGGTVQVTASPAPAAGDQSQALVAAATTSPETTDRLEVLAAAVLASGSAFASVDAPASLASSLALRIGDAVQDLPVMASPPPPPPPSEPPVASPAPTPAPSAPPVAGPGTTITDRILEILGTDAPAGLIEQVVTQQNNVVTQFLTLLVTEEQQQAAEREREAEAQGGDRIDRKQGDIVSTDTQCKPA